MSKRKQIKVLNFISIVKVLFLLFLTGCMPQIDYNKSSESSKPHLLVSREEIYRNPQKVNTLLKEHNITNVRIETEEEFQERLNNFLKISEVNILNVRNKTRQ